MVNSDNVALLPSYAWLAVALSVEAVAGRIETSNCIAVATLATVARVDVKVTALALIAIMTNHIGLAATIA